MAIALTDVVLSGKTRGTAAVALAYAKAKGAKRFDQVTKYINTVYTIAPQVKLDPAIVIAQALEETANFTSSWWANRLNPAGIGITGDPTQDDASHTWTSGDISAKSHLAHLLMYTTGNISGGGLNTSHDVRYAAYVAAYGHKVMIKEVKDFGNGVWEADPNAAASIVENGNACFFPNSAPVADTLPMYAVAGLAQKITLSVPLIQSIIPVGQINQRPGNTRQTPGYWIQHETDNTSVGADAVMHSRYLHNGCPDANGNPTQTSWHFTVDDHQVYQNIPVNEITWQAADGAGPGNMSGVSCEMCVNSDGDEAKARANAEELCAAICFALGLTVNQVKRHWDFNAADPNRHHCPDHMMTQNYWPTFVSNVAVRLAKLQGESTPMPTTTPTTTPAPVKPTVTYPAGMDKDIAAAFFGTLTLDGKEYTYDEAGTVSKAWLAEGKATGCWPSLTDIKTYDVRTFYSFSNGLRFLKTAPSTSVTILK